MILLDLKPIKGDSQISGFENWISCTQIGWDLAREFKESAKGGTSDVFTGVADVKPITLNKTLDCASPDLMQFACGGGINVKEASIVLMASGIEGSDSDPGKSVYCKFVMEHPIIMTWNISGGEDERPTETLALWYYKIKFTYWQFLPGGKKSPDFGPKGWDRINAKPWS